MRTIRKFIVPAIILILALAVVGLLIFIKNQPEPLRGVTPLVNIDTMESDSAKWGVNFPNQYSTLLKTLTNNQRTTYGGSDPVDKLSLDPRLKKLFEGYSFAKSYNEERGHLNSLTDVRSTPRLSDKTPATCYTCKSSDNPKLWNDLGVKAYDAMSFKDMTDKISHPIGCANCHEANTMKLIVTNPALEEALKSQGKEWQSFTRQEMRTVVCANCHVEYYMAQPGNFLTFPWKNGTTIDDIDGYYQEISFSDWKHAKSEAELIKIQHPEYEMYTAGSTHFNAGVSCADCHMPYVRDGSAKFSSHDVKSPLLNSQQTCSACHTDVDYVTERVKIIQKQVNTTMLSTEDAIVEAIDAISAANSVATSDKKLIEEAKNLHRRAQIRWDYTAAENSMGFQNPEETLRILAESTNLARQAQIKALQAVK